MRDAYSSDVEKMIRFPKRQHSSNAKNFAWRTHSHTPLNCNVGQSECILVSRVALMGTVGMQGTLVFGEGSDSQPAESERVVSSHFGKSLLYSFNNNMQQLLSYGGPGVSRLKLANSLLPVQVDFVVVGLRQLQPQGLKVGFGSGNRTGQLVDGRYVSLGRRVSIMILEGLGYSPLLLICCRLCWTVNLCFSIEPPRQSQSQTSL